MKNKKLLYILPPLTLAIWGVIFFKIYNSMTHKDPSAHTEAATQKAPSTKTDTDTFHISGDYRDPFLSRSTGQLMPEAYPGILSSRSALSAITKPVEIFPDIKYGGMIVVARKKQKTGLFHLLGKDYLAREGEVFQAIKVKRLFNDSVVVEYHKKKKTYLK